MFAAFTWNLNGGRGQKVEGGNCNTQSFAILTLLFTFFRVCFVVFSSFLFFCFSPSVSLSQKCTYSTFIASHSCSLTIALFAHLFALTY